MRSAALLNDVDNAISLAGHTDAVQYAGGERGYSNWELSADRANASRRELVAGGMHENKILRVVGLGSSLPLDADDPLNPMNRRISLVVLNDKTERQIRGLPEEPIEEDRRTKPTPRRCSVSVSAGDAPADGEQPPGAEPSPGAAERRLPSTPPERLAQPARRVALRPSVARSRSAAAPHAFPLAPLFLAEERGAVERRTAVGSVLARASARGSARRRRRPSAREAPPRSAAARAASAQPSASRVGTCGVSASGGQRRPDSDA